MKVQGVDFIIKLILKFTIIQIQNLTFYIQDLQSSYDVLLFENKELNKKIDFLNGNEVYKGYSSLYKYLF